MTYPQYSHFLFQYLQRMGDVPGAQGEQSSIINLLLVESLGHKIEIFIINAT